MRKFAEISDLRKDFVCRVCEPFSQQQASQSRIIAKLELGRSWFTTNYQFIGQNINIVLLRITLFTVKTWSGDVILT